MPLSIAWGTEDGGSKFGAILRDHIRADPSEREHLNRSDITYGTVH